MEKNNKNSRQPEKVLIGDLLKSQNKEQNMQQIISECSPSPTRNVRSRSQLFPQPEGHDLRSKSQLFQQAEDHNPLDVNTAYNRLTVMEQTIIETKINDECDNRSLSRSRYLQSGLGMRQNSGLGIRQNSGLGIKSPKQHSTIQNEEKLTNSVHDKILAQKYIYQNFGYDIYEVSDPSFKIDQPEDGYY